MIMGDSSSGDAGLLLHAGNPDLIKMSWGGKRENAGRKPTPTIAARRTMGPRWYVVEAEPRKIHAACRAIIDKGFEAFLPTIAVSVQGRTGRVAVHRPMFFQFLFSRFDADNDDWRAMRGSEELPNGIKRLLLTSSQRPVPVERGLVEFLQETAAERLKLPPEAMQRMKADEIVLIQEGALAGHVAHVLECDGIITRVRVTLFSRPTEVLVRRADLVAE